MNDYNYSSDFSASEEEPDKPIVPYITTNDVTSATITSISAMLNVARNNQILAKTISDNYTLTVNDSYIIIDAATTKTLILPYLDKTPVVPGTSYPGHRLHIKSLGPVSHNIVSTINRINGNSSKYTLQDATVTFVSLGGIWYTFNS